ncbi:hypothetical protein, partial [Cesiribacter andamanensis]|uniref:hypothetical protein n=1 Tax=Cesiribacter andamanensis TaxID=649507 RepID=UPI00058F2A57
MNIGTFFFFTRPAPAARLLPLLWLVLVCLLPLSPLLAQSLTLRDQAEIRYQAQLTLMEYESILNLISNAAVPASAVHDAINSAYHEPSTRIFWAHDVPVDNTLFPSRLSGLEEPNIRALDFIREFAGQYVKSELETVDFYNFQLSDLQQGEYPYILIQYTAHFKGRHKTDPALYPPPGAASPAAGREK